MKSALPASRVPDCFAPTGIKPSAIRPRRTSIVGMGWKRSERLSWAAVAKIDGAALRNSSSVRRAGRVKAGCVGVNGHNNFSLFSAKRTALAQSGRSPAPAPAPSRADRKRGGKRKPEGCTRPDKRSAATCGRWGKPVLCLLGRKRRPLSPPVLRKRIAAQPLCYPLEGVDLPL